MAQACLLRGRGLAKVNPCLGILRIISRRALLMDQRLTGDWVGAPVRQPSRRGLGDNKLGAAIKQWWHLAASAFFPDGRCRDQMQMLEACVAAVATVALSIWMNSLNYVK